LELVGESLRRALNTLATVVPDWMRTHTQSGWTDRYRDRIEDARLPKGDTKRLALAEEIGADGLSLFHSLFEENAPSWLRELPAIRALQRVWIQNYTWQEERLRWRNTEELPPSALMISTPYDEEAHYSKKRSTSWVGYKVHLTETCTEDAPHVITHVETTPSTTPDSELTLGIQTALQAKDLLPHEHLVDLGYIDAGILVASQDDFGIDLIGPAKGDYRWQSRANEGFAAENFQVDWQQQVAICPANKTSSSWTKALDGRQLEVIKIKFSRKDCAPCQFRPQCTHAKKSPRRTITLRSQRQFLAQQAAREREKTADFKKRYSRRAGVEGTISQGVRAFDLRRTRYIGLVKTHLQHLLIAIAINLVRVTRWLTGEKLSVTRQSPFTKLHQPILA
jgi:transposase